MTVAKADNSPWQVQGKIRIEATSDGHLLYTYKAVDIPGFVFVWGRSDTNIEICYEHWDNQDCMYVQSSYDGIEFVNDDGFTEADQLATIGWLAQDWYNQHLTELAECEYCGSHNVEGGK